MERKSFSLGIRKDNWKFQLNCLAENNRGSACEPVDRSTFYLLPNNDRKAGESILLAWEDSDLSKSICIGALPKISGTLFIAIYARYNPNHTQLFRSHLYWLTILLWINQAEIYVRGSIKTSVKIAQETNYMKDARRSQINLPTCCGEANFRSTGMFS